MPAKDHRIVEADLEAPEVYARARAERRRALIPVKRQRRIEIGPHVTLYFENFATMLAQVQEMLYIEKGGRDQIPGELEAYNPLVPQGAELIATLMIEIDEPTRRMATLYKLAGIEDSVFMTVGLERIAASPTDYKDRTSEDGKTSSVHWVRFRFTPDQIAQFRKAEVPVIVGISHPHYGHMAILSQDCRAALAQDFD